MIVRNVRIKSGIWCDGVRGSDGSHTGGHVIRHGEPYVVFGGGEVACPHHAGMRGLEIEWEEQRQQTARAGALS